jgi:hypothetical protein
MAEQSNQPAKEWTPETDPVLARIRASEPNDPEWSEFLRVVEEVRRENPPTIADAAGAFADDAHWDSFMEAIEQYREEQTRAELTRTQRKK